MRGAGNADGTSTQLTLSGSLQAAPGRGGGRGGGGGSAAAAIAPTPHASRMAALIGRRLVVGRVLSIDPCPPVSPMGCGTERQPRSFGSTGITGRIDSCGPRPQGFPTAHLRRAPANPAEYLARVWARRARTVATPAISRFADCRKKGVTVARKRDGGRVDGDSAIRRRG